MHTSFLTSFSLLALLAATPVLAQDVDANEIPEQCSVVCQNLPAVTDECDRLNENDSDETQCVCSATNAQLIIPLCAACVAQYSRDGSDNGKILNASTRFILFQKLTPPDVNDLVSGCSFTTTSFNSDITFSLPSMVVVQSVTNSGGAGTTTTTSSGSSSVSSTGGTATSTATAQPGSSAFNSGSSVIQGGTTSVSNQATSATGNAVSTSSGGGAAPSANAGQGVHALAGAALLVAAAWL